MANMITTSEGDMVYLFRAWPVRLLQWHSPSIASVVASCGTVLEVGNWEISTEKDPDVEITNDHPSAQSLLDIYREDFQVYMN